MLAVFSATGQPMVDTALRVQQDKLHSGYPNLEPPHCLSAFLCLCFHHLLPPPADHTHAASFRLLMTATLRPTLPHPLNALLKRLHLPFLVLLLLLLFYFFFLFFFFFSSSIFLLISPQEISCASPHTRSRWFSNKFYDPGHVFQPGGLVKASDPECRFLPCPESHLPILRLKAISLLYLKVTSTRGHEFSQAAWSKQKPLKATSLRCQAWQVVANEFYDPRHKFSQAAWADELLRALRGAPGGVLSDRRALYEAGGAMFAALGDRYTGLLDPAEFRKVVRRPTPLEREYYAVQYIGGVVAYADAAEAQVLCHAKHMCVASLHAIHRYVASLHARLHRTSSFCIVRLLQSEGDRQTVAPKHTPCWSVS